MYMEGVPKGKFFCIRIFSNLLTFCFNSCAADYFVIMILWVGISVVISAWVLHIYHQEPKDCTWMGPIMKGIVFGFMARVICDKSEDSRGNRSSADDGETNGAAKSEGILAVDQVNTTSDKNGHEMLESEVKKIRQFLEDGKKDQDVDETMKEVEEAPLQEWREAARIIDRFFFWVYALVNISLMLFFTLKSIF